MGFGKIIGDYSFVDYTGSALPSATYGFRPEKEPDDVMEGMSEQELSDLGIYIGTPPSLKGYKFKHKEIEDVVNKVKMSMMTTQLMDACFQLLKSLDEKFDSLAKTSTGQARIKYVVMFVRDKIPAGEKIAFEKALNSIGAAAINIATAGIPGIVQKAESTITQVPEDLIKKLTPYIVGASVIGLGLLLLPTILQTRHKRKS